MIKVAAAEVLHSGVACTAVTLEMGCSDTQFFPLRNTFTFLQTLFYFPLSCTTLGGRGKEIKR